MNSTKRVLPISVLHHTLCLDTHTQSILAQRSPVCGERERRRKGETSLISGSQTSLPPYVHKHWRQRRPRNEAKFYAELEKQQGDLVPPP